MLGLALGLVLAHAEPPPVDISLGARVFFRPDARVNTNFDSEPGDTSWTVPQGVRIMSGFGVGPIRLVAEYEDVRVWGQGPSRNVTPLTGLHAGYLELSGGRSDKLRGSFRAGRQEITMGSGRFLWNSPWQPGGRSFDALRATANVNWLRLDLAGILLTSPGTKTPPDPITGDPEPTESAGDQLLVSEAAVTLFPAVQPAFYYFLLHEDPNNTDGERDRLLHTVGGRISGKVRKTFDYGVEAYVQRGRDKDRDHKAYMVAADASVTMPVKGRPGLAFTYELASGERCETSLCEGTVSRNFEVFFGARHRYRGWMDLVMGTNMRDVSPSLFAKPHDQITFVAAYHYFQLHEPKGQWLRTSGDPVGLGFDLMNDDRTLGHEVDLLVDYRPMPGIRIRPGYSAFIPAGAGAFLAGDEPQHYVYLWIIARLGTQFSTGKTKQ